MHVVYHFHDWHVGISVSWIFVCVDGLKLCLCVCLCSYVLVHTCMRMCMFLFVFVFTVTMRVIMCTTISKCTLISVLKLVCSCLSRPT